MSPSKLSVGRGAVLGEHTNKVNLASTRVLRANLHSNKAKVMFIASKPDGRVCAITKLIHDSVSITEFVTNVDRVIASGSIAPDSLNTSELFTA